MKFGAARAMPLYLARGLCVRGALLVVRGGDSRAAVVAVRPYRFAMSLPLMRVPANCIASTSTRMMSTAAIMMSVRKRWYP